jgi:hypothetical protein
MGTLNQALAILDVLSPVLGLVPVIGENLTAATEITKAILEKVKVCRSCIRFCARNEPEPFHLDDEG